MLSKETSCMLTIVIANPIQFTIVSAVALDSAGAFCATSVENNGESATTAIPQISKNPIKTGSDAKAKTKGESKQQQQDISNENLATCFSPFFRAK